MSSPEHFFTKDEIKKLAIASESIRIANTDIEFIVQRATERQANEENKG